MKKNWVPWLPALVLSLAAAVLGGCAIFVFTLPPAEDNAEALSRELKAKTEECTQLERRQTAQEEERSRLQTELEELERDKALLDQNQSAYDALLARQADWSATVAAIEERYGIGDMFAQTLLPNYDRRCLTYIEKGNTVNSFIGQLFGGVGSAIAGNTQNLTLEGAGAIHGAVSAFNDQVNAAVEPGERAMAELWARRYLADTLYDPEASGAALEYQVKALDLLYPQGASDTGDEAALLHDVACAAKTLECAVPVYATFLSKCPENSDYLNGLQETLNTWNTELSRHDATANSLLAPEELEDIYRQATRWQQSIGQSILNSALWLDTSKRETGLLSPNGHHIYMTCRDGSVAMYATDPKVSPAAFYSFAQDGEPFSFTRGDDVILFDWRARDGSTLLSTCSQQQTQALYRFACLMRDKRTGFTNTEYKEYQQVY